MKNLILSFLLMLGSFFGFTQTLEISFDQYLSFNSSTTGSDYFKIIEDDSVALKEVLFGKNKYIIDFKNKTVDFSSDAAPNSTAKIESVEKKDGFMFIKIKDIDLITNEDIYVYFAINQETEKNKYPYFTFYYESAGMTNGYIVMENNN